MSLIGRYTVRYFSSGTQNWVAEIRCYDTAQTVPATEVASIRFFKSGVQIPADSSTAGKVIVNYSLDRFNDVIGILRNETQVSVDKIAYTALGGGSVSGFAVFSSFEFTGDLEVK